jgi:hypothetical protein
MNCLQHQRDFLGSIVTPARLAKRSDSAHMTHYKVGIGTCGWTKKPSSCVVAFDLARFVS